MGLFDRVVSPEKRTYAATDDFWYTSLAGGMETNAGVAVNTETAMRCSTVMSCVKILGESIGSTPCKLYRRIEGGGKEAVRNHDLYRLVHDAPNPHMSPMDFFGAVMSHLALCGNAYAPKVASKLGRVQSLRLLLPGSLKEAKVQSNGELRYTFAGEDGAEVTFAQEEIVHIPGLAWDGRRGLSPIGYMRETVGLTLAAEEFGARFFGSGTNTGSVMTMPEGTNLNDEQTRKYVQDLSRAHGGLGNSHKLLAVPNGTVFSPVGIPPEEAQFLETRRFQKADIASIFRVPLHMIQETEKATSWGSGIYSMTLNFVAYTLRPWAVRIEQALNRQLLSDEERERGYFFEFNLDALLRGDLDSQAQWFNTAIQNGIMSRNEVREIINRNPVEGGDEYLTPLNLGVAGEASPMDDFEPEPERSACDCGHEHRADEDLSTAQKARQDIQRSYIRVIRDAVDRIQRRERNDILQSAGKIMRSRGVGDLEKFISDFYAGHQEFTREQIEPAFTALSEAVGAAAMREIGQEWQWTRELEQWLADYADAFAARHSNRSRQQLLDLIAATVADGDDVVAALTERFEQWQTGVDDDAATRSEKIAAENSVRLGQGFAREAFFAAGAVSLIWVATGSETCPYCQSLDGRTVGRDESFLSAGEEFAPGGADPMTPSTNILHPPVHAGCDCVLIPGV